MCGLVGVMGKITAQHEKVFKQLLIVDMLRGEHSTGVLTMTHAGKTQVYKKAMDGVDFVNSKRYNMLLGKPQYTLLMGHNRYATKGAIDDDNAHPFEFDNIIGAHNGTLHSQYGLKDSQMFEVDSENLYYHMEHEGLEETYNEISGAWALTWYNREENSFNILRNTQRPLYGTLSTDGKTMFWASEAWMLESILGRNNVAHGNIKSFEVDKHYKFDIPALLPQNQMSVIASPEETVMQKKWKYRGGTTHQGRTGHTNNVSHLPVKQSFGTFQYTDLSQPIYRELNNTVQDFEVVNADSVDAFSQSYVKCRLIDKPAVELRVYCCPKTNNSLYEQLRDSVNIFTAQLSEPMVVQGHLYYKASVRDITEILSSAVGDAVDDEPVADIRGEVISADAFRQITKGECCWCTDVVKPSDEFTWMNGSEVVCEGCHSLDEVQEYIEAGLGGLH